ncbi:MAG: M23 family metallopeptidase [bacterium]
MNEKLKEFFQSKKEVFVFLGLLIVTFVTVIAIADATVFNQNEEGLLDTDEDDTTNEDLDDNNDEDVVAPEVIYKFELPTLGNQIIVREFYDATVDSDKENAIIVNGDQYTMSKGIGFANEDNSAFDVVCIYPGKVLSVEPSEVMGTTITIDHGDNLISVYYSLADTNVVVGEQLEAQSVIGTSGASSFDIAAGVHVHVEVKSGSEFINLTTIIGQTIDEVASSIK